MQTYMANPDKIERKWYVVDAEGCTLGRLEMCIRDRCCDPQIMRKKRLL